jgi:hypothetical protein
MRERHGIEGGEEGREDNWKESEAERAKLLMRIPVHEWAFGAEVCEVGSHYTEKALVLVSSRDARTVGRHNSDADTRAR